MSALKSSALLLVASLVAGITTTSSESQAATFKIIYAFQGGSDGEGPYAPLLDIGGTLYGFTAEGGGTGCGSAELGCGTVFSVTTSGSEKVLYSFSGASDGYGPEGAYKAGNLILGVSETQGGGSELFSVTTAGQFASLTSSNPDWDVNQPPLTKIGKTYYGVVTGNIGATSCANSACGFIYAITP